MKKDLDTSKVLKHEKQVQEVVNTASAMANPFNIEQASLVNISTGVELEDGVADKLLEAEQLGEDQFNDFCKENLFSDDKDIYKKIKKNNIRTFTTKAITVKDSKGQQLAVKSSRNLFAKLLVLSKTRNVDLKELLSFSLSEFPLSLATPTGGFVKTAKSKMFEVMETLGDKSVLVDVQSLPDKSTALLVDAMAVLQVIKGKWKTFGEFADSTLTYLTNLAAKWSATRLDFVGDRYPEISIKNTERARRASVQGICHTSAGDYYIFKLQN